MGVRQRVFRLPLKLSLAMTVAAVWTGPALAEETRPETTAPAREEARIREELRELRAVVRAQGAKLAEQEKRLEEQEARIRALASWNAEAARSYPAIYYRGLTPNGGFIRTQGQPVPPRMNGTGPVPPRTTEPGQGPVAPREPDSPDAAPGAAAGEAARPESERPTEQVLVERGGVLLPPGTLQFEPSIEYQHASSDRVAINGYTIFDAIVIGNIRVDDLDRDIVTASATARYGITKRLQGEIRVPYVFRRDEEILGVGTNNQRAREISGHYIGDVETSLSYQLLNQDGSIPATVLRGRVRFPTGRHPFEIPRETVQTDAGSERRLSEVPTGSGFYAVGGGVTTSWRADPAVLFVGAGYTMNLEREFTTFGTIDPGDTYEFFAGTNVALSELLSLNLSFVEQFTEETLQNGQESVGTSTNDARLVLGSSIGLSPRSSLVMSASAGLTDDSPDFSFNVSVPITLQLF